MDARLLEEEAPQTMEVGDMDEDDRVLYTELDVVADDDDAVSEAAEYASAARGGRAAPRAAPVRPGKTLAAMLASGPLAFLLVAFLPLDGDNTHVALCLGVVLWMAAWWMLEAVPLAVTALLPFVLFPLTGILPSKELPGLYFNETIFLLLGAFLVAKAIEESHLHTRASLMLLSRAGAIGPRAVLAAFMVMSAFLSAWISNTATCSMMLPIALSVAAELQRHLDALPGRDTGIVERYTSCLLLGIAYSCSIGGTMTLVGSPTNLILIRVMSETFPEREEVSFIQWFLFGLPIGILSLAVLFTLLVLVFLRHPADRPHVDAAIFQRKLALLGVLKWREIVAGSVLFLTAVSWFTRSFWKKTLDDPNQISNATVAVLAAVVLFLVPAGQEPHPQLPMLNKKAISSLAWDVLLLLGGGFAMAEGFTRSGLSNFLGEGLAFLAPIPPALLVFVTSAIVAGITAVVSNVATISLALPVFAGLASKLGVDPLMLMVPATVIASHAFILPVSTAPNAVVFASGKLRLATMARVGGMLNVLTWIVICLTSLAIAKPIFGF